MGVVATRVNNHPNKCGHGSTAAVTEVVGEERGRRKRAGESGGLQFLKPRLSLQLSSALFD